MPLADDLLIQAQHLAQLDSRRPNQANLRRAVSSAYYGLFHLLSGESARKMSPATPVAIRNRIARCLNHGDMAKVCRVIDSGNLPAALIELRPQGFTLVLRSLARRFVELQDDRHDADYNLAIRYTRTEAEAAVKTAQSAFAEWKEVRGTEEATIFLAALLFHPRWSR